MKNVNEDPMSTLRAAFNISFSVSINRPFYISGESKEPPHKNAAPRDHINK